MEKGRRRTMEILPFILQMAAFGWSILYMIFGGGMLGAIVIFIIAKFLGK